VSALLASELLKVRTVRSPVLLLIAQLAITAIGVVSVIGADLLDPGRRPVQLAQVVANGLVVATVLGILLVTSEFRHGTITPTFLIEPRRERLVAAKLAVGAVAGLAFGLASTALMLAVAVPWLSARGAPLALDGELAAVLLRLLVAFGLTAALGVGVGFLIRSQVGAIVATLTWFLIAEALLPLVGLLVDRDQGAATVNRYLPGSAFEALVSGGDGNLLSAWASLALLLAYVGVLAAGGLAVTLRRDTA
jgi:ABC-2 type transport system permease protein